LVEALDPEAARPSPQLVPAGCVICAVSRPVADFAFEGQEFNHVLTL
jgi:hypothetical protein